jgi:uncharacterized Zn-binding protein involved in type VI secretion
MTLGIGKIITNPSGGLKACGHPVGATGIKQIVEIVEQLRGTAEKKQVKDAKIGLTHNVGGSGSVFVNNEPIIRKGDKCLCGDPAVGASGTVFANNVPVHRLGDSTGGHGNWVPNSAASGSSNVFADS